MYNLITEEDMGYLRVGGDNVLMFEEGKLVQGNRHHAHANVVADHLDISEKEWDCLTNFEALIALKQRIADVGC